MTRRGVTVLCECGHPEEHHGRDRWGYCLFGCDCQSFRPDDLDDEQRAEIEVEQTHEAEAQAMEP